MNCYHCGEKCSTSNKITYKDLPFCCNGCKTVFEILKHNNLEEYYKFEETPGLKAGQTSTDKFAFLDVPHIRERWELFNNGKLTRVILNLPQIHCSACIWLIENLKRINPFIISCSVNFVKRTATITFSNKDITLKEIVELLTTIGYEPNLHDTTPESSNTLNKTLYYKIGIAGFCFGNIMLLSFPEYLGMDSSFEKFRSFFQIITFLLSIPVVVYSGFGYLSNAIKGIRQRFMNMDIPIAIGIATLFIRSSYEIFSSTGPGYFDSLTGLVFFLLLGKWYQQKTYNSLSFERDYKSYFPIAVNKFNGKGFSPKKIEDLLIGDLIEIRNNELIPGDGVIISGEAFIDYSFVTGESDLSTKRIGDKVFAGGKQTGSIIQIKLIKEVSNSYLTQLWNQEVFNKKESITNLTTISNQISKYFTSIVLIITLITALYWFFHDLPTMWNAVTAVLIVACPCALALSVPFTLGNTIRIMGRKGLYLKNTNVIEQINKISTTVLDKTGTLTHSEKINLSYKGAKLFSDELRAIKSLASNSIHPLSLAIVKFLSKHTTTPITKIVEVPGKGLKGWGEHVHLKLGSASFIDKEETDDFGITKVHIEINGIYKGYYQFEQHYRLGLSSVISYLKKHYDVHLLSGDNDGQKDRLTKDFGMTNLNFNSSPIEKLEFIKEQQARTKSILMLGDGLNDSGALKQSDVGIAISDNIHQFSPACDAILNAKEFKKIPYFIEFSKGSIRIIYWSFTISFLYNLIGLFFAVSGTLSPLVAAILMPLSSVTVVLFSTVATNIIARKVI